MRKLIVIISIILITTPIFSQKYGNAQFTLFSYSFSIDNRLNKELKELEGFIKCNTAEGSDDITTMLTHNIYAALKYNFEESFSNYILPENSYMDEVKYDIFGYPSTSIQTAIKKGGSKYYLKLVADLSPEYDKGKPVKTEKGKIRPVFSIEIQMYTKDGYVPYKVAKGSSTPIEMETGEAILKGLKMVRISNEVNEMEVNNNLQSIITEAIREALSQL